MSETAEARVSTDGVWSRIRPLRASDEIVLQFRQALFNGLIKPGDVLGTEKSLCADFGVSRTTLRDALRTLEASGVIEVRTGVKGGVRVARPDPMRYADILAMQLQLLGAERNDAIAAQAGLESVAAELAATRAVPEDLDALRGILEQSERLVEAGEYRDNGYAFHEAVAKASHNWAIITTLRAIHDLRREPPMQSALFLPRRARRLLEIHTEILQAIREHDGERASALMKDHLRSTSESREG
jgi:GntR family transcriptional repressor for pyruvate dehydrogenase complex